MRIRKTISFILSFVCISGMAGGIAAYASGKAATVQESSMENAYIKLSVEQDSNAGEYLRYKLDTVGGELINKEDDGKNLTYKNFFSGLTTLNINGESFIYGKGKDEATPYFDAENKCHVSVQKFGDVIIEQRLTITEGFASGYDDMLKISYKVKNASENDKIGVRILIDPMISDDDSAKLTAGKAPVSNEAVFIAENIPSQWSATFSGTSKISAYGKVNTSEPAPSSLVFANWDSLYDSIWDYSLDINKPITDSAAAIKWESISNAEGKEFSAYYGIKNLASSGDNDGSVTIKGTPDTGVPSPLFTGSLFGASLISAGALIYINRKRGGKNE